MVKEGALLQKNIPLHLQLIACTTSLADQGRGYMKQAARSEEKTGIHMSQESMAEIRGLPGNNQCCDCSSFHDIQWASVSHGILLCLECAGRHRNLGVKVSAVKSVHMDDWQSDQVLLMLKGGNGQFKETVKKIDSTINLSNNALKIPEKMANVYLSSAVEAYRQNLLRHVHQIMRGDSRSPNVSEETDVFTSSIAEYEDIWPWQQDLSASPADVPCLQNDVSSSFDAQSFVNITFQDGPLGMTLTKDSKSGRAFVSKLIRGGVAHSVGVRVNDSIEEVNDCTTDSYQDAMHQIQNSQRPMTLKFCRRSSLRTDSSDSEVLTDANKHQHLANSSSSDDIDIESSQSLSLFAKIQSHVNSVEEAIVSKDFRITFSSPPLGITVLKDNSYDSAYLSAVIVNEVEEGSQAQSLGVKSGDCIVGIDDNWVADYNDFLLRLKAPKWPVTMIFRRRN